ncbi:MAG: 4Fe-4S binding protein, partial [Candidatus Sericytochromatia bacterium]|nr:4Fe-4S binding protein [Candidatus Tanganyikabacteria bacterium]
MIREVLELTEPRSRIFVKHVYGRFQRLRWIGFALLLAIFLAGPWLQWDGRQAVLLDLPARRFYFFGLIIWPHEMHLLVGLMLALTLALFFFTTLAGRLWCGYACPQTV